MKALHIAIAGILIVPFIAQTSTFGQSEGMLFQPFSEIKWQKIAPDLGDRSPEMSIMHIDPQTHATELMIRVPPNFHVPRHWHSANETHTVVSGTFIMEHEGKKISLGAGSFNYVPKKMIHQGWTKADEGTVLFITVDSAWDVNWVDGPPTAQN